MVESDLLREVVMKRRVMVKEAWRYYHHLTSNIGVLHDDAKEHVCVVANVYKSLD
jgi:hypothetical protein